MNLRVSPPGANTRKGTWPPGPVFPALAGDQRAVQHRLVTAVAQLGDHGPGHTGVLVGGDRDAHPRQRY